MPGRFWIFLLLTGVLSAQDERRVASPNGQIEFHLFIAGAQDDSPLSRIAYRVTVGSQPLIDRSFLGLDILNQEPLLGENDGLLSSKSTSGGRYNSLVARYMQDGSLGRLIDVEVRAYNDGIAFRYVIPPSTPLIDLLIADDATEFRFAGRVEKGPVFQVGANWVAIAQSKEGNFPPMRLVETGPNTLVAHLTRSGNAALAFEGTTPFVCPWRTIAIGPTRESVARSQFAAEVNR